MNQNIQDSLRESYKNKFTIFDNMPYRVYVRNRFGIIVYANEMTRDILLCSPSKIVGKKYEDIFKDDGFINQLQKHDEIFCKTKLKFFVSMQEQNKYYKKEGIVKVIDFLDEQKNESFIVTILVELNDTFNIKNSLSFSNHGVLNPVSRIFYFNNKETINLTKTENSLLLLLYEKKGEVVDYDEIFLTLDIKNKMTKNSLKMIIYRLKKKIGKSIIENVLDLGYRLNL